MVHVTAMSRVIDWIVLMFNVQGSDICLLVFPHSELFFLVPLYGLNELYSTISLQRMTTTGRIEILPRDREIALSSTWFTRDTFLEILPSCLHDDSSFIHVCRTIYFVRLIRFEATELSLIRITQIKHSCRRSISEE